ncbi:MAG TPA: lipocalin family protein [Polyangiales bacterium]|nr:lipocalin family protein [Polyangiales bacterium]
MRGLCSRNLAWGAGTFLALATCVLGARAQTDFVRTFEVDPAKYLGLWYEVARTPNDFEDDLPTIQGTKYGPCLDATATYALIDRDNLRVSNVCVREAISDPSRDLSDGVTGVAKIGQGSDNRKLKVAFGSKVARFFQRLFTGGGADYWIYGVGPENEEGQYSWALVSNEKRDNIFILARSKGLPSAQIQEVLALAQREHLPAADLIFTQR